MHNIKLLIAAKFFLQVFFFKFQTCFCPVVYNTGNMPVQHSTNIDTYVKYKVLSLHISIWILQDTNLKLRIQSIQMQFCSNHKHTKHSNCSYTLDRIFKTPALSRS